MRELVACLNDSIRKSVLLGEFFVFAALVAVYPASGSDGQFQGPTTHELVHSLRVRCGRIHSVAFSPGGESVALAS